MRTPPEFTTAKASVVVFAQYTRHCSSTLLLHWLLKAVAPDQSPCRSTMPRPRGLVTCTLTMRAIRQKRRSIAASLWFTSRRFSRELPSVALRSIALRPLRISAKSLITYRLPMRCMACCWSFTVRVNPLLSGPSISVAPAPSITSRRRSGSTMSCPQRYSAASLNRTTVASSGSSAKKRATLALAGTT